MKMILNPNKEKVLEILKSIKENKEKYGDRYCPCVNPAKYNSEDYVCICKQFRDMMAQGYLGECHCGLYISVQED